MGYRNALQSSACEAAGAGSDDAYAVAAIELYSRLWLELEQVTARLRLAADHCGAVQLEVRLTILRLELVMLLDGCDSQRWRALIGPRRCSELGATLRDLLAALSAPFEALDRGLLDRTQDRILDATLAQCATIGRCVTQNKPGAG